MNYSIAFDLFAELGKLISEFGVRWCVLARTAKGIYPRLPGEPGDLIYSLFAYACISLIPARRACFAIAVSVVRDAKLSRARRIPRRSPQRNPLWFTVRGSSFNIRGSFEKDTTLLCTGRAISYATRSITERRNMDSILPMSGICSTTFLRRSRTLL